jgi:low temperature requirement protein LtrA
MGGFDFQSLLSDAEYNWPWIVLGCALFIWQYQKNNNVTRFRIRISVVFISIALYPVYYAINNPGAFVVNYMAPVSVVFLVLAIVAFRREQAERKREKEEKEEKK